MAGFDPSNPFGLPDLSAEDHQRLHGHVEEQSARFELEWREREIFWLQGEGNIEEAWFTSPILRTEFDYWVALHEIGHHALQLPTFDDDGSVLFDNEVDVWIWALDAAIITPSEGAAAQMRMTLGTHDGQLPTRATMDRLRSSLPRDGEMTWR